MTSEMPKQSGQIAKRILGFILKKEDILSWKKYI